MGELFMAAAVVSSESQAVSTSPTNQTYKVNGARWIQTPEAHKCGNVSESRGGLTDCVLEADHIGDHLRKAGLRSGDQGHGERSAAGEHGAAEEHLPVVDGPVGGGEGDAGRIGLVRLPRLGKVVSRACGTAGH